MALTAPRSFGARELIGLTHTLADANLWLSAPHTTHTLSVCGSNLELSLFDAGVPSSHVLNVSTCSILKTHITYGFYMFSSSLPSTRTVVTFGWSGTATRLTASTQI